MPSYKPDDLMNTKLERLKHAEAMRKRGSLPDALTQLEQILSDYGPDAHVLKLVAQIENSLYQTYIADESERAKVYETQALQHIREAIALEPANALYYVILGYFLEWSDPPQVQEALDTYRRALRVEPLCWDALASACFLAGHPDADLGLQEAMRYGELATRIRPTRSLLLRMAKIYKWTGDLAASERAMIASLTETIE